jgi:hypothetical protein
VSEGGVERKEKKRKKRTKETEGGKKSRERADREVAYVISGRASLFFIFSNPALPK